MVSIEAVDDQILLLPSLVVCDVGVGMNGST